MDELFAKDATFFHDNFAGSLTKRVLSFASRFEEFVDTLAFSVIGRLVPLLFGSVVLWQYEPLLVVALLVMITVTAACVLPLVRRRQALVDRREEAIARVSGHVSDSLMNMDTVRAFAAEESEAAEHRLRVAESRGLMLRCVLVGTVGSWSRRRRSTPSVPARRRGPAHAPTALPTCHPPPSERTARRRSATAHTARAGHAAEPRSATATARPSTHLDLPQDQLSDRP